MKKLLGLALAAAVAAGSVSAPPARAVEGPVVLILSAFPAEQTKLLSRAKDEGLVTEVEQLFNGRRFFAGTLSGKNVVMGLTGIGLPNAEATTQAALDYLDPNNVSGIIFSGVANYPLLDQSRRIGDVAVPEFWWDANDDPNQAQPLFKVDDGMYLAAVAVENGGVSLDACVPIPDTACTGVRPDLVRTPLCVDDPDLYVGGVGRSSDPYAGRKVSCLTGAGSLLGCEACGAPPSPSPEVILKFAEDSSDFVDPEFFIGLFTSFFPPFPDIKGAAVQDMETAAVARVASTEGIPFIAFRGYSDSSADVPEFPPFPYVEFFVYQELAADNAAAAVIEFLDQWMP